MQRETISANAVQIADSVLDPHPEWWRKATAIRSWINDPRAGDREDEETDGPFAESIRMEDLIAETPARTLDGVRAQVALVIHALDEIGSHSDNDILALKNALATLDRLAGGQAHV